MIDHRTLLAAAENLITIDEAGHTDKLLPEFGQRCREAGVVATTWRDPLAAWRTRERAKLLSHLTGADIEQCTSAVDEAAGNLPSRKIGLELLADYAQQVRQARFKTWRATA